MRAGQLRHRITIQQEEAPGVAFTAASRAAACSITSTAHGLRTGFRIVIAGVVQADWTALNGTRIVIRTGDNTFTVPVNTSAFGAAYVPASNSGATITVMADEYGQDSLSWTSFAEVWAEILPLRGVELFTAQQFQSKVTSKIRIRYLAGVGPKMRVMFGARIFWIETIINTTEQCRELVLMCSEVLE